MSFGANLVVFHLYALILIFLFPMTSRNGQADSVRLRTSNTDRPPFPSDSGWSFPFGHSKTEEINPRREEWYAPESRAVKLLKGNKQAQGKFIEVCLVSDEGGVPTLEKTTGVVGRRLLDPGTDPAQIAIGPSLGAWLKQEFCWHTYIHSSRAPTIRSPPSPPSAEGNGPSLAQLTSPMEARTVMKGIRILMVDCYLGRHSFSEYELPFTKSEYDELQNTLGFSEVELEGIITTPLARSTQRLVVGSSGQQLRCFIIKIGVQTIGYHTVVISHNLVTEVTSVLVLAQTDLKYNGFRRIHKQYEDTTYRHLHPLGIIPVLAERVADICSKAVDTADRRLNFVQWRMGQHTYHSRSRGDPLGMDFTWATRVLNHQSTVIAMNKMRLNGVQMILKKAKSFEQLLRREFRTEGGSSVDHIIKLHKRGEDQFQEMIDVVEDLSEQLLQKIDYEQQRIQTQLEAVYTYMTAKDSLVNMGLAADSRAIASAAKQDSSAMKTIAVLTMVFLPGTYIAALFAMPLFDWDAQDGRSVLKDRFKYYWAITIPLTAVVVLVWTLLLLVPWKQYLPRGEPVLDGHLPMRNHRPSSILDNDSVYDD